MNTKLTLLISLVMISSQLIAGSHVSGDEGKKNELERVEGKIPPDYKLLKRTLGGAYFIKKGFKEKYEQIKIELEDLKKEIASGKISSKEATDQLKSLKGDLTAIKQLIDEDKVLVSPAKVFKQTETTEFKMTDEKLLVITADGVHLKGWDGDTVKCVLEKKFLTAGEKPSKDEFQQVKAIHKQGSFPELVGQTRSWWADHIKESETNPKFTEEQKINNIKLKKQIRDSWKDYVGFQGKNIDVIEFSGLLYQQGNRNIIINMKSSKAGGSSSSQWKRHATLTVYVPKCQKILLRGCLVGLNLENINSDLILTTEGNQNRDYDGRFLINGLEGNLLVKNVPLHSVENVKGNVTINTTVEHVNSSSNFRGNLITKLEGPPRKTQFKNIQGDLTAWFQRSDLKLESIAGKIDVRNEFGDTELILEKNLAEKAHRIISLSGEIRTRILNPDEFSLPLIAATCSGIIRSNIYNSSDNGFDITTHDSVDGSRRSWSGIKSIEKNNKGMMDYSRMGRIDKAVNNLKRSPGLDIISRNGKVIVEK